MLSLETTFTFLSASCLLALAPGPDNLFVLTQSAMRGRGAGLIIVCGLCLGLVVHTLAVALGVATLFAQSPVAFTVLKGIGALYLAWLAWQAFWAPAQGLDASQVQDGGILGLLGRGFFMNITNPKVSLFFLAFLPQFVDPMHGAIPQLMALGGLFILSTLLVFGTLALFSGVIGEWLRRSSRMQLVLNRMAGGVFLALAVQVALLRR